MTTIIAVFSLSLVFSLILTPMVCRIARKYRLLEDIPSARKVHTHPIPRAGGVAIFLAFFLTIFICFYYRTKIFEHLSLDSRVTYLLLGGCVAFGLGLWDDLRRLRPNVKFAVQGLAALIVYIGGIRIETVGLPGMSVWSLGWFSLPVTVMWVLLVTNAINLMDGLDGLAAGVSFFVCTVLLFICVIGELSAVAIGLASLAGAILGFLRYNFNPASIFLGDGGSYFLGYMLATMSMLGSMKNQAAVTILIPMIALGLPLIDTFWSSARRFILGQSIFYPDRDHFHHKLLNLGYTHQRAVMVLYGITICMGGISMILVYTRDERAALVLLLAGVSFVFGIRKLGYLEYVNVGKVLGWFVDISDEVGIRRDRRAFLSKQVSICGADNLYQFWGRIINAAEYISLNAVALELDPTCFGSPLPKFSWESQSASMSSNRQCDRCILVALPLVDNGTYYGELRLKKVLNQLEGNGHRLVLNRTEHLRRSVTSGLQSLAEKAITRPDVLKNRRRAFRANEKLFTMHQSVKGFAGRGIT